VSNVVVIGSGVGGLASALELRRRGFEVTVLERLGAVGGKAQERRTDDFRWDAGPSIVVMTWVYHQLFQAAGLDPDRYLRFKRLDPAFRVAFSTGGSIELPADLDGVERAFGAIDPADARALGPFMERLDRFAAAIRHAYCDRLFENWGQILISPLFTSARIVSPRSRYEDEVNRAFRSPEIRELLRGFPTYSGFDPRTAPASLLIIPWTILREGVWYPETGGIAAIPRALAAACEDLGVDVRLGVEVEAIERSPDGAVRSVATSSGNIEADAVVSNADYLMTHRLLRGGPPLPAAIERLRAGEAQPSSSYLTVQLGCDRTWEHLAHHLLLMTEGSRRVYEEVLTQDDYPSDPPLYLNVTSATDPADAPPGGCNPFLVVSAPALKPGQASNRAFEAEYADRLIERLDARLLPGLAESVVARHVTGPFDFGSRFLGFRGGLHGLGNDHNILGGGFRPLNVSEQVAGLYFAGGGVQPGPGLPMAVQSGKITAERLARDVARRSYRTPLQPATARR